VTLLGTFFSKKKHFFVLAKYYLIASKILPILLVFVGVIKSSFKASEKILNCGLVEKYLSNLRLENI
jgi:hypothetical protein